jgi:hypothetical protein
MQDKSPRARDRGERSKAGRNRRVGKLGVARDFARFG